MLEAQGYPDKDGALTAVANHLKVPLSTLRGWFTATRNPPPAEVRNEKKGDLVALIESEIYHALGEMGKKRIDAEYRELATAFGIMVDKLQLLTGEPTQRNDTRFIFERSGLSTIPEHLTPSTNGSYPELEKIQRSGLRPPVG